MRYDRVEFRPYYHPEYHKEPLSIGACVEGELYFPPLNAQSLFETLLHEAGHRFLSYRETSLSACMQPKDLKKARIDVPKHSASSYRYSSWFPDLVLHRNQQRNILDLVDIVIRRITYNKCTLESVPIHLNLRPEAMEALFIDDPQALSFSFDPYRYGGELAAYSFQFAGMQLVRNSLGISSELYEHAMKRERVHESETHEVAFYHAFDTLRAGTVWQATQYM